MASRVTELHSRLLYWRRKIRGTAAFLDADHAPFFVAPGIEIEKGFGFYYDRSQGLMPLIEPQMIFLTRLNTATFGVVLDSKKMKAAFFGEVFETDILLGWLDLSRNDDGLICPNPGTFIYENEAKRLARLGVIYGAIAREECERLGYDAPIELAVDSIRSFIRQVWTMFVDFSRLAHCRNVSVVEKNYGLERNLKRRRKGKPDKFFDSYYVLEIPQTGDYWYGANSGKGDSKQLRHHVVRGHFKTYTEDAPRFGRPDQVGDFWIPSHARGNPELGRIEKDYRLTEGAQ